MPFDPVGQRAHHLAVDVRGDHPAVVGVAHRQRPGVREHREAVPLLEQAEGQRAVVLVRVAGPPPLHVAAQVGGDQRGEAGRFERGGAGARQADVPETPVEGRPERVERGDRGPLVAHLPQQAGQQRADVPAAAGQRVGGDAGDARHRAYGAPDVLRHRDRAGRGERRAVLVDDQRAVVLVVRQEGAVALGDVTAVGRRGLKGVRLDQERRGEPLVAFDPANLDQRQRRCAVVDASYSLTTSASSATGSKLASASASIGSCWPGTVAGAPVGAGRNTNVR